MTAERRIHTLIEVLKKSEKYLKEKGIASPRLEAEWMIQEVLGISRIGLYLNFDRPLTSPELSKLREYVIRRSRGEPIQYILGHTEFMGLKFLVNREVLIPRPDTEVIVEKTIEIIKENPQRTFEILDVGTGSGNIAVSIANYCENVSIVAIDISSKILDVARKNARLNKVHREIRFYVKDFLKHNLNSLGAYDILVSNPPYVGAVHYEKLPIEIKEHEPKIALFPGDDELIFYRKIASVYKMLLKPDGYIITEIGGDYQYKSIENIFKEAGLEVIEPIFDYAKEKRGIIAKVNG